MRRGLAGSVPAWPTALGWGTLRWQIGRRAVCALSRLRARRRIAGKKENLMASPQLQMAKVAYKAVMDSGAKTPQELRVVFEKFAAASPLPPDIKSEKVNAGGIEAEWISAPNAAADRAVLYVHGGGYARRDPRRQTADTGRGRVPLAVGRYGRNRQVDGVQGGDRPGGSARGPAGDGRGLSRRTGPALAARGAALRGPQGLAAAADSGRRGRDAARRFNSPGRSREGRGSHRQARSVARNDPCMATVCVVPAGGPAGDRWNRRLPERAYRLNRAQ